MKCKKLSIILILTSLVSCDSNDNISNVYYDNLTPLDNVSINLPELKEGTKTYLPDRQGLDGVRPFDYKIEDGYQIISNILKVSSFYEKERGDGWYPRHILYYFPDNTYAEVYLIKVKADSDYFKDSYFICFSSTYYYKSGYIYCCVYKDEGLYNQFVEYFEECEKVAGDYISDPRYNH